MTDDGASTPELPLPVQRLQTVFRRIEQERMQGVSILNPSLHVEAVGFSPWNGYWLGVLVTPWFINLVLLPAEPKAMPPAAPGEYITFTFPSGAYDFLTGDEEGLGPYLSCSLFSPVLEFADQEAARATAVSALQLLFVSAVGVDTLAHSDAPESGEEAAGIRERAQAPLSRRGFLTGAVLRGR